ncbi:hypothetical protein SGCOL_006390 [Colletotrichum sp. CLE4]
MEATPDFDIIIGGRAYDPAPYVAYSMYQLKLQHPGLTSEQVEARHGGFLHMGKIMECGGQCSIPKSHGAVATVYESGMFDVRPIASASRCTPLSVAAHSLYENTRPDILRGPGGALHLDQAHYEQLDDQRTVRARGARFVSSIADGKPYQFKLEAARILGYRSIVLGSVKDHILIGQLDELFMLVKAYVRQQHKDVPGNWDLDFHTYGQEQTTPTGPGEIFIIAEAIAPTQELATGLVSTARIALIHGPYAGQKATSGNFAFGIAGKLEIETGPCAQFSVYHLIDLKPGEERLTTTSESQGNTSILRSSISRFGEGQSLGSREPLPSDGEPQSTDGPATKGKKAHKSPRGSSSSPESIVDHPKTLSDISRVLRSKNAGPYEITMDVIFESESIFNTIRESELLSPLNVADALGISKDEIVWIGFFEPALAFKVTIPRFRGGKKASAGSFMENDIHGSQQHLGLSILKLPQDLATLKT